VAGPADDAGPATGEPIRGGLPPYRAVLAVDAEGSTDVPSARMGQMSEDIVHVLAAAFSRAGLASSWAGRRFQIQAHRGDGYVVGLPTETLPKLLHPFLRDLQAELRARDGQRQASQPRLRLRASIHVGPLPDDGGWTAGVGKPMAETHRLLDSDKVRDLLRQTHQEVTFLAVIVSKRVFEDVVEARYSELHPDEFSKVDAIAKQFAAEAYLYLPQHSTRMAAGVRSGPG